MLPDYKAHRDGKMKAIPVSFDYEFNKICMVYILITPHLSDSRGL
jgi:hypothetical protein